MDGVQLFPTVIQIHFLHIIFEATTVAYSNINNLYYWGYAVWQPYTKWTNDWPAYICPCVLSCTTIINQPNLKILVNIQNIVLEFCFFNN